MSTSTHLKLEHGSLKNLNGAWVLYVVSTYGKSVFVNGFMHMMEFTQIVAVDMEGKTWRKIRRPTSNAISIHEAQGRLCLCTTDSLNRYELSI